jgi:hypothetical protein
MPQPQKNTSSQVDQTKSASARPDKRPYHSPILRQHGSISQQTLALPAGILVPGDGGAFPNFYSS